MQVSAEIRYFWKTSPPEGLYEWFQSGKAQPFAAGGGETRLDSYLRNPAQDELSVKRRGRQVGLEVKGLIARCNKHLPSPFVGQAELWAKWTCSSIDLGRSTITVEKQRWLRKFDTTGVAPAEIALDLSEKPLDVRRQLPRDGCNVELTKLTVNNSVLWWTLGFEAFGLLWLVEQNLARVAEVLAARNPPAILPQLISGYPAWLNSDACR